MHLDVQTLHNFYYRSAIGRVAQRVVRDQVTAFWPNAKNQTLGGFGFAVPLLRPYLSDARRVIGLMPGQQGVMPWPAEKPNVSVLCEETLWPVENERFDKLVLMHGLETSERQSALLDECWRVLAPGAKALFIVPNRSGLWARSDETPFGYGRPYSMGQLEAQLKAHHFEPLRHAAVLYQPPSTRRFWMKTGPMWEKIGRSVSALVAGGIFMVEVSKISPKPSGTRATSRVLNPLGHLVPAPNAKPARARLPVDVSRVTSERASCRDGGNQRGCRS
ncbi:methyltransferase domain-containing protein [Marivita sp. S0852]|uniref:methyltransferase domain-containing protein n=1 Tax=Marivita sp. S0852 TaxID=3373893 RepID=UPI0039827F69